jgi:DNA-binding Lrp family transcriptional regulator
MRLADVLAQVDGLNKRFVYYLEALAYIQPAKIRKSRIARRDYSQADLARIKGIWAYYRRGFSIPAAREMVEQSDRTTAYLLLASPANRWADALALLQSNARVREVAFVYGETTNVFVRIAAPDNTEALSVLNEVFDRGDLVGAPAVLRVSLSAAGPGAPRLPKEGEMQAYLLIRVPAKHAGGVLDTLREIDGVAEASVVYGETDIVARIVAASQDEFDELVINRIQDIPAVESTRTFIVVGKMHWRREMPRDGAEPERSPAGSSFAR